MYCLDSARAQAMWFSIFWLSNENLLKVVQKWEKFATIFDN